MSTTDTETHNNYSFFQLADELSARRERLRPLWVMTPAERLARFGRGEMSQEEMYAWAARCPGEVPRLSPQTNSVLAAADASSFDDPLAIEPAGEFIFIAATTPEACVACPTCGADEVHLEAGGRLAKHPDHRHAFDPHNPTVLRPVCPAVAAAIADSDPVFNDSGQAQFSEHALAA